MKIEFLSDGFKELLNSEEIKAEIETHTNEIRDRANSNYGGDGFVSNVVQGYHGSRWVGFVSSSDKESAIAESENQALTRAL